MKQIFNGVLMMSISSSVVILIIIMLRFIIKKKVSKTFIFILWILVLMKLMVPLSVESPVSLFNVLSIPRAITSDNIETQTMDLSENKSNNENTTITYDSRYEDDLVLPNASEEQGNMTESVNVVNYQKISGETLLDFLPYIWLFGMLLLLISGIVMYLRLSKLLSDGILYKTLDNGVKVYKSVKVTSPVLIGFLAPSIIIPKNLMLEENEFEYIIEHEVMHMKRFDHITKPIFLMVTCIHWFNPLVWIAYFMAMKDMELSCDEQVLKGYDYKNRCMYANALLNISIVQNNLSFSGVVAFSENSTKSRVKSVLNFKKIPKLISIGSVVLLIILIATLMTQAEKNKTLKEELGAEVDTSLEESTIQSEEILIDLAETVVSGSNEYDSSQITENSTQITENSIQITENSTQEEINVIVEDLLRTIMSSPTDGTQSYDYIQEHQAAFDQIVDLDIQALPYLFGEFNKGGQIDLRAKVMKSACVDILQGDNIKVDTETVQEWYDELKAHTIYLAENNSYEFVTYNAPKLALLLEKTNYFYAYDMVNFSDGMVEIAGEKIPYNNAGAQSISDILNGIQVEQMMYRGVLFYKSAYYRDYGALNKFASEQLLDKMNLWHDGEASDSIVQVMMELNQYIGSDFPGYIEAPRLVDSKYSIYAVRIKSKDDISVDISFIIDDEGIPKVNGLVIEEYVYE